MPSCPSLPESGWKFRERESNSRSDLRLIQLARKKMAVVIVGHVTKEGEIAGKNIGTYGGHGVVF